jgi:hypothetical protein
MDQDIISPKNNRAGELHQCLIVPRFLLIPHKEFYEPVWTLPQLIDTKINGKYTRRRERDGKERQ